MDRADCRGRARRAAFADRFAQRLATREARLLPTLGLAPAKDRVCRLRVHATRRLHSQCRVKLSRAGERWCGSHRLQWSRAVYAQARRGSRWLSSGRSCLRPLHASLALARHRARPSRAARCRRTSSARPRPRSSPPSGRRSVRSSRPPSPRIPSQSGFLALQHRRKRHPGARRAHRRGAVEHRRPVLTCGPATRSDGRCSTASSPPPIAAYACACSSTTSKRRATTPRSRRCMPTPTSRYASSTPTRAAGCAYCSISAASTSSIAACTISCSSPTGRWPWSADATSPTTTSAWARSRLPRLRPLGDWPGRARGGGQLRPLLEQQVGLSDQLAAQGVSAGEAAAGAAALRRQGHRGSRRFPYPLPHDRNEALAWLAHIHRDAIWGPAEVVYDDPKTMGDPAHSPPGLVWQRLVALAGQAEHEIVAENAYLIPPQKSASGAACCASAASRCAC